MGFKVQINGEQVWESDGDPIFVDKISVVNARGEVASVGSPAIDDWINLVINVRADTEAPTYLDLIEQKKVQARRDAMELGEDREIEDGTHVKADPETGLPVEEEDTTDDFSLTTPMTTPVTTDEEKQAEMAGDVGF